MRAALTALIVGLAVGCAEFARFAPVPPAIVGNSATLALPLDVVWERTMRVLATQKPVVKNAHPADFFITTSKATVRLDETQADCGTYSGRPYLKDGRTLTEVAYSVYLQGNEKQTSILVNAEIEGRFQGTATHEVTTALSCVSLGTLERDLIRKVWESAGVAARSPYRR